MRPGYKTKTTVGVGVGLALQIAAGALLYEGVLSTIIGITVIVVAAVPFTWGCMNYAEGKGHPKWFGYVGLLSFFGLIILIMLPDYYKGAKY